MHPFGVSLHTPTKCEQIICLPSAGGFHFQFKLQKVQIVSVSVPDEKAFGEEIVDYLQAALESANTAVRAVIICNPHNPLGQCYPAKTLKAVAKFCERYDLHLLSDELYALSVFESPDLPNAAPFTSILAIDAQKLGVSPSRLHTMWSVSKDLACNGFRIVSRLVCFNPPKISSVEIFIQLTTCRRGFSPVTTVNSLLVFL